MYCYVNNKKNLEMDSDDLLAHILLSTSHRHRSTPRLNAKHGLAILATLLSALVLRYGIQHGLRKFKQVLHEEHAHSELTIPNNSKLSSNLSVIVRMLDDKGRLYTGETSEFLQEVWEIIGNTIAKDEKRIEPTVIPDSNGTVSFITIPTPSKTDVAVSELVLKLQKTHLIPIKTPSRGPLAGLKFVKFDSTVADNIIHPELVITIII